MGVISGSQPEDARSIRVAGIESFMVIVAQMGEHRIVAPKVVSSRLISHLIIGGYSSGSEATLSRWSDGVSTRTDYLD